MRANIRANVREVEGPGGILAAVVIVIVMVTAQIH